MVLSATTHGALRVPHPPLQPGVARMWRELHAGVRGTAIPPAPTQAFFLDQLLRARPNVARQFPLPVATLQKGLDNFGSGEAALREQWGLLTTLAQRFHFWRGVITQNAGARVTDPSRMSWIGPTEPRMAAEAAWEAAEAIDLRQRLPDTLSAAQRAVARWFRFRVFYWYGGALRTTMPYIADLERLFRHGVLPDHDRRPQHCGPFYAVLIDILGGDRPADRRRAELLARAALRDQRGWACPFARRASARKRFHLWFCHGLLTRRWGMLPDRADRGRGRAMIAFRATGKLPRENRGKLTAAKFVHDVICVGAGSDPEAAQIGRALSLAAIYETQGWGKPRHEEPPEVTAFREWLRDGVAKRYGGVPMTKGDGTLSSDSPVRVFLDGGSLPNDNRQGFSLRVFFTHCLDLGAGRDLAEQAHGRRLIRAAVQADRGWGQPPPGIGPAVSGLLSWFRDGLIDTHGGVIPTEAEAGIGVHSPLRDFVARGHLPDRSHGISTMTVYDLILRLGAGSHPDRRTEGERLVDAAVRERLGWDRPFPNLHLAIQRLLDAFRAVVIKRCRGLPGWKGQWAIPGQKKNPLRRFLMTGALPRKNNSQLFLRDFYRDLSRWLIDGDPERNGNRAGEWIAGAIDALHGWDRPAGRGESPKVTALRNALRAAARRHYGGAIPKGNGHDAGLPVNSPLRPFIHGIGPLAPGGHWRAGAVAFLMSHHVPTEEANTLVHGAAQSLRGRS